MARLTPILLLLLAAGCAAPRSGSFHQFSAAVKSGQSGLEALMEQDVDWTREADVQALAADPRAKLSGLMIVTKGKTWRLDEEPAYWEARRAQRALLAMNAAFREYTVLLASAAAGAAAPADRFDAAAGDWNAGLRLWNEGAPDAEKTAARDAALLTEAFHQYARGRRAADLRRGVAQNQPWVEAYAKHGAALAALIRADLGAAYGGQLKAIHAGWDDKRAPGRVTLTRSLFNLNDGYAGALEALDGVERFFAALPAAHRALADKPGAPAAAAVRELALSAERIDGLARRLEKMK